MLGSRVRSPPVRPFDEANDQGTTLCRAFCILPHNLRDHAGPGTRRTLARSSPHDPSGCFAVGVRPVDIPHHGQLVQAGADAGTLTCVCMFAYSQIQCCERFNGGIKIQWWNFVGSQRCCVVHLFIAPAMKCRERSKPVGRGLRPRRNAKPTNLRCEIVADRPECDPYQTVSCHNISSPHL